MYTKGCNWGAHQEIIRMVARTREDSFLVAVHTANVTDQTLIASASNQGDESPIWSLPRSIAGHF